MRHVCVIGAGIVGCTTAYQLVRTGFKVTLIDREPAAGQGTSFANGAQLSYSYVQPLASPQTLCTLPAVLAGRTAGLRFQPRMDLNQWSWGLRFLWACRPGVSARGTAWLLDLARLSRAVLERWIAEEGWQASLACNGKLVLCPDQATLAAQRQQVALQAGLGCHQDVLSPAECIEREPALALRRVPFAGGIWTSDECVVDPLLLCREMARSVERRGGRLMLATEVLGFEQRAGRLHAVNTRRGEVEADAFVLAAGTDAVPLAAGVGLRLPIYPIKGYSITLRYRHADRPRVSVTDLGAKAVLAPLADRLRVAAMAEVVGHDREVPPQRLRAMLDCVEQNYPSLCMADDPRPWAGLRPATPDSIPIVGQWRRSNLYLNVGHGALGLTLAAGSAARVAEAIVSSPRAAARVRTGRSANTSTHRDPVS